LTRRSGTEITFVYGRMQRRYSEWLASGRPERKYRDILRKN